jgi:hypothetical protein
MNFSGDARLLSGWASALTPSTDIAGSFIARVSLRRRAFRHSRAPIRKRADHAIYNCDHIVSFVGARPAYLVHNGRIDSYFARRCACGCGGSVASGTPRHRIEFQALAIANWKPIAQFAKVVPREWAIHHVLESRQSSGANERFNGCRSAG